MYVTTIQRLNTVESKLVKKILLSFSSAVTLKLGQGNWNWYQSFKFNGSYLHVKFIKLNGSYFHAKFSLKSCIFNAPMTKFGHCHRYRYKIGKLSGFFHHGKFENSCLHSLQERAKVTLVTSWRDTLRYIDKWFFTLVKNVRCCCQTFFIKVHKIMNVTCTVSWAWNCRQTLQEPEVTDQFNPVVALCSNICRSVESGLYECLW